jgi:hypothetical protein
MNREECPRCGEQSLEILEIPRWNEDKVDISIFCWNELDQEGDHLNIEAEISPIPEKHSTKCLSCLKQHRPVNIEKPANSLCEECRDKIVVRDTDFGIIIPQETGIIYRNQTSGMRCSSRFVEGTKIKFKKHKFNGLMNELAKANYQYHHEKAQEIWEKINEKLWFEYEKVEPPENQMDNTEAFQWIKITDVEDSDQHNTEFNREQLEGRTVAMTYKNCD